MAGIAGLRSSLQAECQEEEGGGISLRCDWLTDFQGIGLGLES